MAAPSSASIRSTNDLPITARNYRSAISLLASLFFTWGFITVINNTLLPHLRRVFDLNYTQTTLIESVWFIAYFLLPYHLPNNRFRYHIAASRSEPICRGHRFATIGSLATEPRPGIQFAGNDLRAAVWRISHTWPIQRGHCRRWPCSYAGRADGGCPGCAVTVFDRCSRTDRAGPRYRAFPLPAIGTASSRPTKEQRLAHSLWRHRNLVFGIPAIFIYLIAEIGVGNLFINFVSQPEIGNLSHEQGAHYLFLLWGGMMVGRFIGGVLMRSLSAESVLAAASLGALLVMLVATFSTGHLAMWALISVGLFHSLCSRRSSRLVSEVWGL